MKRLQPTEVRDIRTQLGLTQRELAGRLGMSYDAVRDWERGKAPCKGPAALALRLIAALWDTRRALVEGIWS